jgi:alcohol dehydrogenase class IV
MSVIVNSPSAFRFTAPASPERHLEGAAYLGADVRDVKPQEAGELLATHLIGMMRQTGMPNGISGVGYREQDIPALAQGAIAQERLLKNSPIPVRKQDLEALYRGGFSYW